jgi:hypothetical protein
VFALAFKPLGCTALSRFETGGETSPPTLAGMG